MGTAVNSILFESSSIYLDKVGSYDNYQNNVMFSYHIAYVILSLISARAKYTPRQDRGWAVSGGVGGPRAML